MRVSDDELEKAKKIQDDVVRRRWKLMPSTAASLQIRHDPMGSRSTPSASVAPAQEEGGQLPDHRKKDEEGGNYLAAANQRSLAADLGSSCRPPLLLAVEVGLLTVLRGGVELRSQVLELLHTQVATPSRTHQVWVCVCGVNNSEQGKKNLEIICVCVCGVGRFGHRTCKLLLHSMEVSSTASSCSTPLDNTHLGFEGGERWRSLSS
jgi:hypothetical protein